MRFLKSEQIEDKKLNSYDLVDVTEMGNIVEIRYMSKKNKTNVIRRIDDNRYIDLRTGEINKCEQSEKRIDRINSLKSSFRRLRNLINANVVNARNCQWVTLTYAENMQNPERLYKDFEKFHKRYKYYMTKKGFERFEYISVIEPQGRGAWHIHLLYIFETKPPYVPNDELREIWGHGFVTIQSLDDVDNVGAYLTAFLGDLPLDIMENMAKVEKTSKNDDNEVRKHIKVDEKTGKKYIKGGRLHFYPSNMNLYRTSRGVKRPVTEEMYYDEAEKRVSGAIKTFSKTVKLVTDDDLEIIINTQYYNKIRKIK